MSSDEEFCAPKIIANLYASMFNRMTPEELEEERRVVEEANLDLAWRRLVLSKIENLHADLRELRKEKSRLGENLIVLSEKVLALDTRLGLYEKLIKGAWALAVLLGLERFYHWFFK